MNACYHLIPKPAQTDSTKPDMKASCYFFCDKNAEVKAGKENVRTNIRQEQQVKSVARTNQSNVAESRSNQKKTTVQKQVNQKTEIKDYLKTLEERTEKNEIKAYPYHRYDISSPFLHRPFGILIPTKMTTVPTAIRLFILVFNLSADVLKHQPMVERYAREKWYPGVCERPACHHTGGKVAV